VTGGAAGGAAGGSTTATTGAAPARRRTTAAGRAGRALTAVPRAHAWRGVAAVSGGAANAAVCAPPVVMAGVGGRRGELEGGKGHAEQRAAVGKGWQGRQAEACLPLDEGGGRKAAPAATRNAL